jgi:hypothetical protein
MGVSPGVDEEVDRRKRLVKRLSNKFEVKRFSRAH